MAAAHRECPLHPPSNRNQNAAQFTPQTLEAPQGPAGPPHPSPQHSHPRTPVRGSPVANGSPKISPAKIQPASRERPTQSTQRLSGGPHTRSLTVAAPLSCSRSCSRFVLVLVLVLVLDAPTQRQPAFPFAASRLRVSPTARPASLPPCLPATASDKQQVAEGRSRAGKHERRKDSTPADSRPRLACGTAVHRAKTHSTANAPVLCSGWKARATFGGWGEGAVSPVNSRFNEPSGRATAPNLPANTEAASPTAQAATPRQPQTSPP